MCVLWYHCFSVLSTLRHFSLLTTNQLRHEYSVESRARNCWSISKEYNTANVQQKTKEEQMKHWWRKLLQLCIVVYIIKMPKVLDRNAPNIISSCNTLLSQLSTVIFIEKCIIIQNTHQTQLLMIFISLDHGKNTVKGQKFEMKNWRSKFEMMKNWKCYRIDAVRTRQMKQLSHMGWILSDTQKNHSFLITS